jgi:predicted ribosome quality control (RQC) complex YloA/Tae2 family protein
MVKITIFLNKNVHENASIYFDKAKKAKKKIQGANVAILNTKKKLSKLEKKGIENNNQTTLTKRTKKEWYEKFRWFYSSKGFLVIGGRDATTNEILIKKYTDKEDIVFHTDMAGSPFFVIKQKIKYNKEDNNYVIGEKTLQETANATASFSRAWKGGYSTADVFYVNSEQLSKEAQHGEYLQKGSFMIKGKTTYLKPIIQIAICILDDKIMSGPIDAIKEYAKEYIIINQGDKKPSEIAKEIKKQFKFNDIDEIIRALPSNSCKIKEIVKNKI